MNMQSNMNISAPAINQHSQSSADIVIVGNGIAGLTAAMEARRFAPDKRIIIITEQCHPTINTPSLKQFIIGKLEREQLLAYPIGTERRQRIHVLHGKVDEINAQGKYVSLAGGGCIGYGSLLLATGSTARGLPAHIPGRDFDGVLTLHRLKDYVDLRRRLDEVNEAVVIGGGIHAIETAVSLLHLGIQTHWFIHLSILDDRLIGYISFGQMQADGLAIKHLIDEGVSIRPVKEALLKGTFDARKYFSQQHSSSVLTIATSGKLPVVKTTQPSIPLARGPMNWAPTLAGFGVGRNELGPYGGSLPATPKTPVASMLVPLPSAPPRRQSSSLLSYNGKREQFSF